MGEKKKPISSPVPIADLSEDPQTISKLRMNRLESFLLGLLFLSLALFLLFFGSPKTTTVTLDTPMTPVRSLEETDSEVEREYVLNKNSMRFHFPECSSVATIKDSNREAFTGLRSELLRQGYSPCGNCSP